MLLHAIITVFHSRLFLQKEKKKKKKRKRQSLVKNQHLKPPARNVISV